MKNNIKIKIAMVLLILSVSTISKAQQDAMYTQYMFNTQTYNPAYAGTWESVGFMALTRNQWVGIENYPRTQTFSFQSPVGKEKVALGLNIVYDRIGKEKKLGIFGDYSYKLKVTEKTNLRLGFKGGFTNYSNNLSEYDLYDPNDPAYSESLENIFLPNVGIGAFLYSNRYYIGFASPKLIENSFDKSSANYSSNGEFTHLFVNAGVVMDVNEWLKFKPTALVKLALDIPVQFDFSANFLISETLWLGAMYRTNDAWGVIAQILIKQKLRVGYAMDFTLSDLSNFHDGIHEIMISYELKFLKERFVSPRYF